MSFSQRMGLKQKPAIQLESMDEALRNSLFNVVRPFLLEGLADSTTANRGLSKGRFNKMWSGFFKLPLHKSPANYAGDANSNAFIYDFLKKQTGTGYTMLLSSWLKCQMERSLGQGNCI